MKVLKKDIIQELTYEMRERTGHAYITQADATAAYEAMLDIIADSLANGNEVHMKHFGTFCTTEVAERPRRNVHTGEEIIVPAGRKLRFRPSKDLKERAES